MLFFFMLQERGILKEANLEKKIPSPLKDTTAKDSKAIRKHQNVNRLSFTVNLNQYLSLFTNVYLKFAFSFPFRKMKLVSHTVNKTIIAAVTRNQTNL